MQFLVQALKFGVAGVVNTAVGYGVFALCLLVFEWSPIWSNVLAYTVGLFVSLTLMRTWVFPSSARKRVYAAVFLAIFAISYVLNLGALALLLEFTILSPLIAQLFAMATYSVSFFLLGKKFLHRPDEEEAPLSHI